MNLPTARLALLGTLALALACGDDGDDDTAAGTTADPTGSSTAAPATGTASEAGSTAASGDETADPAVVCEALACSEGQICVATGSCPEEPLCVPAETVACDFGSGLCTVVDVCTGTLADGALDCEQCL